MKFVNFLLYSLLIISIVACNNEKLEVDKNLEAQAQLFLDKYNIDYQKYLYASSKAEWKSNTYIVEGDTLTEKLVQDANEAFSAERI